MARLSAECPGDEARRDPRDPLHQLPLIAKLAGLEPDMRALLRAILLDLQSDARMRAEHIRRTRKPPMAAYWAAVGVYAGHLARRLKEEREAQGGASSGGGSC